jgi:predicted MFS family arabinose efflux permease
MVCKSDSVGSTFWKILGPVLGGVLASAVGARWVFVANAVTFLVSVALVRSVRRPFSGTHSAEEAEEHRGVVAGFRFIRHDAMLRRIVVGAAAMILGLGMAMVADRPFAEHFGVGATGFGAIISCWGAGSVIGSFLGRRLTERTEPRWVALGTLGIALTSLGIGVSPAFWPVLVFFAANGAAGNKALKYTSKEFRAFQTALDHVTRELARRDLERLLLCRLAPPQHAARPHQPLEDFRIMRRMQHEQPHPI